MEKLFKLIFPPKCIVCGLEGDSYCKQCLAKQKVLGLPANEMLGSFKLFSVFEYSGGVRECIRVAKYKRKEFSVLKDLCQKVFSGLNLSGVGYYVVPIPAHRSKLKVRGFNQVDIIAKEFARLCGGVYAPKLLIRQRSTTAQYAKNRSERYRDLAGVFEVQGPVHDAKVILVDDVCTSGATMLSAAHTMLSAGSSEVVCFALSRAVSKL